MEFARNSILKLMDDMNNEEREEIIESQPLLKRIFGKRRKEK